MNKLIVGLIILLILVGCQTSAVWKSTQTYSDGTEVKINSSVDQSFHEKIDRVAISVLTTDRISKYNITLVLKEFDFATELENAIASDLKAMDIANFIYHSSNLDLKTNSIDIFIKSNQANYLLEFQHLSNITHSGLVVTQKYDISLYSINTKSRVWRGQIEIGRSTFGSGGLTERSAIFFSNKLLQQLRADGLNI